MMISRVLLDDDQSRLPSSEMRENAFLVTEVAGGEDPSLGKGNTPSIRPHTR